MVSLIKDWIDGNLPDALLSLYYAINFYFIFLFIPVSDNLMYTRLLFAAFDHCIYSAWHKSVIDMCCMQIIIVKFKVQRW